jgi:hypothetical protein
MNYKFFKLVLYILSGGSIYHKPSPTLKARINALPADMKDFYCREILPLQQKHEEERNKLLNKIFFYGAGWIIGGLLIGGGAVYYSYRLHGGYDVPEITLTFIASIGVWGGFKRDLDPYVTCYGNEGKEKISSVIIGYCGDFIYSKFVSKPQTNAFAEQSNPLPLAPSGVPSLIQNMVLQRAANFPYLDNLKASKIIPEYDRAQIEDEIKGSYKNISIELFESTLEEWSHSSDNRGTPRYVTKFRGVFILLSCNKQFSGQTVIVKKSMISDFLGLSFEGLEPVNLEDPQFASHFSVYSTDQVEARYLLTTSFISRFVELSNSINHRVSALFDLRHVTNISCSFFQNQLLMMIPSSRNLFELGDITQHAVDPQHFIDFVQDIRLIQAIIDDLKLDLNIKM